MDACFMGARLYWSTYSYYCCKTWGKSNGVDINPKVVEMTNEGKLHIIEPGCKIYLRK